MSSITSGSIIRLSGASPHCQWPFFGRLRLFAAEGRTRLGRTCETTGMPGASLQATLDLQDNALGLEENMLERMIIAVGVAGSVLLVCAGPTMAKKKPKVTEKTSAILTQPQCTGMKTMHWDDATQTCQKNK